MSDREIELKLVCEPAELDRLGRAPVIRRMKQGRASGKHLHSVYFDTEDLVLGTHGLALRLRKSGRACVQTLKTDTGASGGTTGALARDTGEYEARLPRNAAGPDLNKLPGKLKTRIQKLANGDVIGPRLVSDVRRTIHNLETPEGDVIELALDRGALRAEGGEARVSEIELELKKGTPASLYRIALDLSETMELHVGFRSKSERGFALLRPKKPAAVKAETLTLARDATLEEAYAAVLRHCLVHMTANESATLDARLPEALHQMRVALRRARSALKIFAPVIGGPLAERLADDAKWLAGELGAARDLDVFLAEIIAPVEPRDASMVQLQDRAEAMRSENWERATAALRSRRYTRFLLQYGLLLAGRAWRVKRKAPEHARDFATRALDKRMEKVLKRGHNIASLKGDERHELRKELKKLRYALHFLCSLYDPETIKPYLKNLSQMQDVFGALNDVATAHLILEQIGKGEAQAAAKRVLSWHEIRAEKEWKGALRLWQRFRKTTPFWQAAAG